METTTIELLKIGLTFILILGVIAHLSDVWKTTGKRDTNKQ